MTSTSMPPPPAPISHRRTRVNAPLPPSPSSSPSESPCLPRKMSLSKGATFHFSSSPPDEEDPVLSIRHLARRSPTSSRSSLLSLVSEKQGGALRSIRDFEDSFFGGRGHTQKSRRPSAAEHFQIAQVVLPTDEGLGSSIHSSTSEKKLASTFDRILDLVDKDSGLGSSIHPSEESVLVKDLIQDTDTLDPAVARTTQQGNQASQATSASKARSAVTHSISPYPLTRRRSFLSNFAQRKISRHIITPILREDRFKFFHPLVTNLASSPNESIRCLRDLEQSLIFQPLRLGVSQYLYRLFSEFSIQLVVDTYHHLSEHDQRRHSDKPYNSGYFLDLVQQVGQLAAHMGRVRAANNGEEVTDDEMAYSPDDEVTIEGGLAETGNVAELVRWKNGQGISLRTGEPYEPTPGVKRQHSNEEFGEDALRSMARRKKGEIPKVIELRCADKTCGKTFTRKCDLAKHEKTHSRPFKCPHETCKYHELGLPTEKERDRHINDKHDPNPLFYRCEFCEFKTKRESNCKQHMEKKHDWRYERVKGTGKTTRGTPSATPQTPSMDYSPSEQSPAQSYFMDDGSSVSGSVIGSTHNTPFHEPVNTIPMQNTPAQSTSWPLFPRGTYVHAQPDFGFETHGQMYPQATQQPTGYGAINNASVSPQMMRTPVTPGYSVISPSVHSDQDLAIHMDYQTTGAYGYNGYGLPTPESAMMPTHSHNPSTYVSPIDYRMSAPAFPTEQTAYPANADLNDYVSHSQLPEDDFNFNDFVVSTTGLPATSAHVGNSGSLFEDNLGSQQYFSFQDEAMDDGYDAFINYNGEN